MKMKKNIQIYCKMINLCWKFNIQSPISCSLLFFYSLHKKFTSIISIKSSLNIYCRQWYREFTKNHDLFYSHNFYYKLVKNELGVDDHFDTSAERKRQKMVIWKHDLTNFSNKQIYSKIVGISFNNFSLSLDVIRFYAKCLD